ncbi:unknown [Catenibacterium sp. CAG:290]|nr:unknown [Catenibacterium sp. CAG:290]
MMRDILVTLCSLGFVCISQKVKTQLKYYAYRNQKGH